MIVAIVFAFVFLLVLLPLIVHIWALVDISGTRDDVFGPPWDNTKQDWMLGLAIAFLIPMGHLIAPILWWTQVRGPKLRGEPPGRPFWASAPRPPPPGLGMPQNFPFPGQVPGQGFPSQGQQQQQQQVYGQPPYRPGPPY